MPFSIGAGTARVASDAERMNEVLHRPGSAATWLACFRHSAPYRPSILYLYRSHLCPLLPLRPPRPSGTPTSPMRPSGSHLSSMKRP